jgi:hypothetical protein
MPQAAAAGKNMGTQMYNKLSEQDKATITVAAT